MDIATPPPSKAPVYPDQIQPGCHYDPADHTTSACACPVAHPVLAIVLWPVWAFLPSRVHWWVCGLPCWHRPPPGHPDQSPPLPKDPPMLRRLALAVLVIASTTLLLAVYAHNLASMP